MQFATIIELSGLAVVLLTHLVLIVSKFQEHGNKLSSIEKRFNDLQESQARLTESSKTLHNIEGKIEILINLYQKQLK